MGGGYPGYDHRWAGRTSFYPEKLAEAVLRIFGDEAFCAKISEAEKRRARMAHNGVLNYERLLEIYKDICES